ncbi:MAG: hypothetical protein P1U42_02980 [Phycisphaerales bacterium]|nr:hypothetical protein [Phycisphaerales bacterium]
MNKLKISTVYVIAGVVLPGTVMAGARFVGQGTSQSNASSIPENTPQFMSFQSDHFIEANSSNGLAKDEYIESPFWFEDLSELQYQDPFEQVIEPAPQMLNEVSEIHVTSILPHPKNPLAIINSKACSIGDMIDDRWKLIKINGKARTIILADKSGKRITISLTKIP